MNMETTTEPTPKAVSTKPPAAKPTKKAPRKAKKAKPKAAKKPALKKSKKPKASLKHPESKHVVKVTGIANKAEFIRSLPKDMPAKEVVRLAKLRGTQLTESYVYNTRGLLKIKAKRTKLSVNGAYGKGTVTRVPLENALDRSMRVAAAREAQAKPLTVEELFYAVVAEIGTVKAVHMLMAAHDTVKRALSGVPVT